jgi:adenylylsulfate kinase
MDKGQHITEHSYCISRKAREQANGHKAACVWFVGLSGSGKSTLANHVEQELFNMGIKTFSLDGDNIRKGLNKDLTFTAADRDENLRRISEVVKLLCDAGLVVIASFITPFAHERKALRAFLGESFHEIYVDTPLEVCEKRDTKGLYKKARNGEIENFTGISSPFEAPESPDTHITTSTLTIDQSVRLVMDQILPKIKLNV